MLLKFERICRYSYEVMSRKWCVRIVGLVAVLAVMSGASDENACYENCNEYKPNAALVYCTYL